MARREKQIDVSRSNYSVIDNEFDNMRERFDKEMVRIEEEMGRLRREFEGYAPRMTNGQPAGIAAAPTQRRAQLSNQAAPSLTETAAPKYDPYLDRIKSPLIKEERDGKSLRLRFNVSQYLPEEVTVKTMDNRLLVHAKHEEKSPQRTVFREYNQEFLLPRGTDAELITSSLSTDGVLTVEAPLPAIQAPPAASR